MTLKETSARLSTHGMSPTLELIHRPTGEILQTLQVRPASQEHRSFIISVWMRSYRPIARRIGILQDFDRSEPAIAESRWQDCTVVTDDDGYTVYSWICGYDGLLVHAYTIPELRGIGVVRALTGKVCGPRFSVARPWPYKNKHVNPYGLCVKA